jgi:[ribosomal protein S18]-alanine N-acetyltransferase
MGRVNRVKSIGIILHPRIRAFEESDLAGVLRIERAAFKRDAWPREAFVEYAKAAPKLFLVARIDHAMAGYSIATFTRYGAEIESVAVLPHYRKLGIASALLKRTIQGAQRGGAPAVSLMVRRKNAAAIRLYRSLGFLRVATVANYYGDGRAGWRMRKAIA